MTSKDSSKNFPSSNYEDRISVSRSVEHRLYNGAQEAPQFYEHYLYFSTQICPTIGRWGGVRRSQTHTFLRCTAGC